LLICHAFYAFWYQTLGQRKMQTESVRKLLAISILLNLDQLSRLIGPVQILPFVPQFLGAEKTGEAM